MERYRHFLETLYIIIVILDQPSYCWKYILHGKWFDASSYHYDLMPAHQESVPIKMPSFQRTRSWPQLKNITEHQNTHRNTNRKHPTAQRATSRKRGRITVHNRTTVHAMPCPDVTEVREYRHVIHAVFGGNDTTERPKMHI